MVMIMYLNYLIQAHDFVLTGNSSGMESLWKPLLFLGSFIIALDIVVIGALEPVKVKGVPSARWKNYWKLLFSINIILGASIVLEVLSFYIIVVLNL